MPSDPRSSGERPRGKRTPTVEETSAGGVVVDRSAQPPRIAMIGRRDRRGRLTWSLPKGHIEEGESATQAAEREVHEETGIEGKVVTSLGAIDFWFMTGQQRVHKTVHHFLLEATGGELSHDDIEVEESRWFTFDDARKTAAYQDERELIAAAHQWLADNPWPGAAA